LIFLEKGISGSIAHSVLNSWNMVNKQKIRQDVVNSLLPEPVRLKKRARDKKPQGACALRRISQTGSSAYKAGALMRGSTVPEN
jgi:hypothetical protein